MIRGEIWWAELEEPKGSAPGYRRPVVIVQSDAFNQSSIKTVVVIALSSNLKLGEAPGNVLLEHKHSGLEKDSIANVSQVLTIDKDVLTERIGMVSRLKMKAIEQGIRLVLNI